MNVVEELNLRAAESPARLALIEGTQKTRSITYGDLLTRSSSVAASLEREGIRKGDRVLIFHPPSLELYVVVVAIFRIGAVAMIVEPAGGASLLAAACGMAAPTALLASPRAHLLRFLSKPLRAIPLKLTTGWTVLPAIGLHAHSAAGSSGVADVASDDPALITFTSGSTGIPKAVVRTHATLLAQRGALSELTARVGEVELCTLPIVTLANLSAGATTVLPDADLRYPALVGAARIVAQIKTHGCSRLTAPPAIVERIVAECARTGDKLLGLRTVVTGGGPVFPSLIAGTRAIAPASRVIAVYGSTEAEPIAHVSAGDIGPREYKMMREGAGLLAGTISPATDVRILAYRGQEAVAALTSSELDAMTLPSEEVGEIVVAGAHVVGGYLHGVGDAATKIRAAGRIWHRTGDLGRMDELGRLWLLGRAAAAVLDTDGAMYPFAVECALRERFGLTEVVALAADGRRTVVLGGNSEGVTDSDIRESVPWAHIAHIKRIDTIPMDARHNSKVDYAELRHRIHSTG